LSDIEIDLIFQALGSNQSSQKKEIVIWLTKTHLLTARLILLVPAQ
jgi:hypothetical protein